MSSIPFAFLSSLSSFTYSLDRKFPAVSPRLMHDSFQIQYRLRQILLFSMNADPISFASGDPPLTWRRHIESRRFDRGERSITYPRTWQRRRRSNHVFFNKYRLMSEDVMVHRKCLIMKENSPYSAASISSDHFSQRTGACY